MGLIEFRRRVLICQQMRLGDPKNCEFVCSEVTFDNKYGYVLAIKQSTNVFNKLQCF